MSIFDKSQWAEWAGEWGFQHLPQKGPWARNEGIVGMRDGRLVSVGWGGRKNATLVVLVRFARCENPDAVRAALVADTTLDALPRKGAGRWKMARERNAANPIWTALPEFTLGDSSLVWTHRPLWSRPGPAKVRGWVELLLAALSRATRPLEGRCETCGTAGVGAYVIVADQPRLLCAACQQRLLEQGEAAERAYDMESAQHLAGTLAAAVAALVGAVAWALLEIATHRIFAALAIATGVLVAWAYRRAAGRVDAAGRAIAAALTLLSVVAGDWLIVSLALWQEQPERGPRLVQAALVYAAAVARAPATLVPSLVFGLFGAWIATRSLRRPRFRPDIRQAGEDPREKQRTAA